MKISFYKIILYTRCYSQSDDIRHPVYALIRFFPSVFPFIARFIRFSVRILRNNEITFFNLFLYLLLVFFQAKIESILKVEGVNEIPY